MGGYNPSVTAYAVPPPFTQGRLWCGANLLDKFKFVELFYKLEFILII